MPNKNPLVKQPDLAPTRKVAYVSAAGALFTTAVWLLGEFYDIHMPSEVQGALHTAIGLTIGYVVLDRENI